MASSITTFFHRCAGADLTILHSPECRTEHAKFVGVGSAVFFTALFAWISSSFALYYVFQSYWVILIGLVWALFIFSLDRYIVSTIRKGHGLLAALRSAGPRLLIAIFLAMVVSKPLELRIFQQEIDNKLHDIDQDERKHLGEKVLLRNQQIRQQAQAKLDKLEQQLNSLRERRDAQEKRALNELNGTGGSTHYGNGPAYRREEEGAQLLRKEYDTLDAQFSPQIAQLRQQVTQLDEETRKEIADQLGQRHVPTGLLARIDALGQLTSNDNMKAAGRALMLLFIVIEIAPVLVKVLSPEGPYDVKLDSIEQQVRARELEAVSQINGEVNRNIQISLGESEQAIQTQLRGNQALLNQINGAQLELAQEMIDQWKDGELDKLRGRATQFLPQDATALYPVPNSLPLHE